MLFQLYNLIGYLKQGKNGRMTHQCGHSFNSCKNILVYQILLCGRMIHYVIRITYICTKSQLKQKVLLGSHTSLVGGHSGFLKTYHKVKKELFWEGLKSNVRRFMEKCLVCQQNKVDIVKTPFLLQPLYITCQCLEEVSMDFIIDILM